MKMLILAAGQGKRLRPLTDNIPKCMVRYKDKPIIDHIIETAKRCGIEEIAVVSGYKKNILEEYLKESNLKFYSNYQFDSSNMVTTLFCAKKFMDDDLIISYADIVYNDQVLEKLIKFDDNFGVIVDRKWKELWLKRMANPLDDAETLKIKNGQIVELGKKPKNYMDVEGQYIGLIKISKKIINEVIKFYENLDKNSIYNGQDFKKMYLTSFIQIAINNSFKIKPVFINGGWIEIDSPDDLLIEMV
jgi:L-glutamine-phosphate cytidylyltransferase